MKCCAPWPGKDMDKKRIIYALSKTAIHTLMNLGLPKTKAAMVEDYVMRRLSTATPEELTTANIEYERYGFPACVGCGYCCLKIPCHQAVRRFGDRVTDKTRYAEKMCPALYWDGKKYRCELAKDLKAYKALSMGEGCCSPLNTWRSDVRERTRGERINSIASGLFAMAKGHE